MDRTLVGSGIFVALLVVVSSCAGEDVSSPQTGSESPLLRIPGGEAGPATGGWYGMRGIFEPYREGKRLGVGFRLQNRAAAPLTLLNASQPEQEGSLLRLVGVRFALVPPEDPATAGLLNPMLQEPDGLGEPEAVVVPPEREVFVQFNFEMGECDDYAAEAVKRYNEAAAFRYVLEGEEAVTTVDLSGLTVTVTEPRPKDWGP